MLKIRNSKIVTPHGVINNGTLIIEDGQIKDIDSSTISAPGINEIDAEGGWIIPGIIDTHSDAIEKEIQPGKKIRFSIEASLLEMDKLLVTNGITTIYHAVAMLEENGGDWVRNNGTVEKIVDEIRQLRFKPTLIDHRIHLRLEVTNITAVPIVEKLINQKSVDYLSITDHTPGQGQYSNIEARTQFVMRKNKVSAHEALELIKQEMNRERISTETVAKLVQQANQYRIPVASHDDDTITKVESMKALNARISEFPINIETAKAAKEAGMYVVMGAPNLILGRSRSNNLSALEAIQNGVVDILCSDYYPPSLLRSVYFLYSNGWPMENAIKLVTEHPARAMGIFDTTGSIEVGKHADLLLLTERSKCFFLNKVLVKGEVVCSFQY
jgi:alpha-D-ribose 1-methylphosphonate 5-triphosphate diphosphatase